MKKLTFIILLNIGFSFAYAAPISQCSDILALSRSDFSAEINDPNQVQSISETLDSCAKQNACAQINNITNCASELANRVFDSNFKAYEIAAASTNTNTYSAAPNNTIVAPTNNNAPATTNYIAPLANPNAAPAPKQSINWF